MKRLKSVGSDEGGEYYVGIYNMRCTIDYDTLNNNMGKIYLKLK